MVVELNQASLGSFFEYIPVVLPLLESTTVILSNGSATNVSFDVILPSIPGFTFSSDIPSSDVADHSTLNIARLWNTLVVDVLGYNHGYAVAGSDWVGFAKYCLCTFG